MGGCVCNKGLQVNIDFKNTAYSIQNPTTDYNTFIAKLKKAIPELKYNHFFVHTNESPGLVIASADSYLDSLRRYKRSLNARVELVPNFVFSTSDWRGAANSVFKLIGKDNVVGTGFIVSYRYAILAVESLKGRPLKEYFALFSDGFTSKFDYVGVLVEFLNEEDRPTLALVKLKDHGKLSLQNFMEPIQINFEPHETSTANVLYYTTDMPVLQTAQAQLSTTGGRMNKLDIQLPTGAAGAPILDEDCKLIGVLCNSTPGGGQDSYTTNKILQLLLELKEKPTLYPGIIHAIDDIFKHSSVRALEVSALSSSVIHTLSDVQAEFTPRKISLPKSSWLEDNPKQGLDLARSVYRISLKEKSIVACPPGYYSEFKYPCGEAFTDGCSLVTTPDGLVITGASTRSKHCAWRWAQDGLTALPDMLNPHEFHCSVFYRRRVVVIAGLHSPSAESFKTNSWFAIDPLPGLRSSPTGTVFNDLIYVVGGLTEEQLPSDTVYISDGRSWRTCDFTVGHPLSEAGALSIDDKLIIFGGKTSGAKQEEVQDNLETFVIDENGHVTPGVKLRFAGSYSSSCVCYNGDSVYVYSKTGQLVQFSKGSQRFAAVTVGQELL